MHVSDVARTRCIYLALELLEAADLQRTLWQRISRCSDVHVHRTACTVYTYIDSIFWQKNFRPCRVCRPEVPSGDPVAGRRVASCQVRLGQLWETFVVRRVCHITPCPPSAVISRPACDMAHGSVAFEGDCRSADGAVNGCGPAHVGRHTRPASCESHEPDTACSSVVLTESIGATNLVLKVSRPGTSVHISKPVPHGIVIGKTAVPSLCSWLLLLWRVVQAIARP